MNMLAILKWFFGVIFALILLYVLITLVRTVFKSGISGIGEIVQTASTTNIISTTTGIVSSTTANVVSGFSFAVLSQYILNRNPLALAGNQNSPGHINIDSQNAFFANGGFYNRDNRDNTSLLNEQNSQMQNLNTGKNNHPTDWQPIGNEEEYNKFWNIKANFNNSGEYEETKTSDKFIRINLDKNSLIKENEVVTGKAFFKVFSKREFFVYLLDMKGNVISKNKMFVNGDIEQNGFVNFRGVITFEKKNNINKQGYLLFKSDNFEISGIKALNLIQIKY